MLLQRIGLSATVRPIEEVAAYLAPNTHIVDVGLAERASTILLVFGEGFAELVEIFDCAVIEPGVDVCGGWWTHRTGGGGYAWVQASRPPSRT